MARQEQDREDLLRQATALVQRAELQLADCKEPFVVGFRRDGSGSLYVGSDLVFQFNQQSELRRGFWNGRLIKAEAGRLFELTRVRSATHVQLRRRELDAGETHSYIELFQSAVRQLLAAVAHDKCLVVGQVPADQDVLARAVAWLTVLADNMRIANVPNVR